MRSSLSLGWLLCFVAFLAHIYCEDVFGIVGENFTFPVKIDQKIVEIIWTKNKDKVAEWEGQNKTTYFTSLRNRGLLNEENGCLTIFDLENNDTGTYMLDYVDSMKKSYVLTFRLAVLGRRKCPTGRVAWNSPVHGSDISGKNSSLLAKHADDHGLNEGEVTQDAEGGNEEQLSNPPCCSTEAMEEKR
ncbi:lymphocyte function-associated antigen 3 isoform X8 [Falco naumanni]|uniref:lymphocyte function-associated antigen 3 isoform X8 n=1 Tax=Falco naumanni TaxID=148594 RepID=UPI001ADE8D0E|nr:lymphocyte function-associated antigen 3 isoform X8 [Falco naumanni]